ncbi:hypothetical protein GCM10022243_42790 [Saccharothrix violaceirubra]|uniref:Restriction system protein n=1 Tax=Saccharothrix violaceirubra TaxID=413306 RepID=A0A7W7WW38_9PSEU|nr:restriction endonuclease [Saccharothrix violaceirubra]MBB4965567.1 restriction system protein [Saccharothrix violaceirubra]
MTTRPRKSRKPDWKPGLAVAVAAVIVLPPFFRSHPVLSVTVTTLVVLGATTWFALRLRAGRIEAERQAGRDRAIEVTDGMTGPEFEQWTARLLRRSGCRDVEVVGGTGDAGADVVAWTPGGKRVVVQCKRHVRKITSPDVQRFGGVFHYHRADVALLIATTTFTEPAQRIAAGVGILLVDRTALAEWARTNVPPLPLSR